MRVNSHLFASVSTYSCKRAAVLRVFLILSPFACSGVANKSGATSQNIFDYHLSSASDAVLSASPTSSHFRFLTNFIAPTRSLVFKSCIGSFLSSFSSFLG